MMTYRMLESEFKKYIFFDEKIAEQDRRGGISGYFFDVLYIRDMRSMSFVLLSHMVTNF